jgi:cystathionine beta-lyase
LIPLWVADMDFEAAPAIRKALQKRVEHGVFGYAIVQDSYYDAVINWYERRHQWHIEREWIQYTTGVVPAISAVIKALTMPGERVLIMTPVYNCFFSSIRNNGCEVLESKLKPIEAKSPQIPTPNPSQGEGSLNTLSHQDIATEANQAPLPWGGAGGGPLLTYSVDWDDFERKCADEKCTVFLLCNPHNPAGRVWTREELQRMNDICQRHHVRIISDEIHCELVMPGHVFVPFGRVSTPLPSREATGVFRAATGVAAAPQRGANPSFATEEQGAGWVICCSPSKSFNTAGLQMANIICADAETRRRIDRAININEICDVNPFAPLAVEAAYNESEDWIDELNQYLWGNYQALLAFFAEQLPQLKVFKLEGTYLVWVDITALRVSADEIEEKLLREARVWVNSGTMYGADGYIRINIATQRARLMEGLKRMASTLATCPLT